MRNRYRRGQHKLVDDRTGFTIYSGDARKEWNGRIVHKDEYESRHPQDFVRGVAEDPGVREARPAQEPRFLGDNEVTADDL